MLPVSNPKVMQRTMGAGPCGMVWWHWWGCMVWCGMAWGHLCGCMVHCGIAGLYGAWQGGLYGGRVKWGWRILPFYTQGLAFCHDGDRELMFLPIAPSKVLEGSYEFCIAHLG